MNHGVDPASGLHVVKSSNDDLELTEEVFIKLLHEISMGRDDHTFNSLHYESSGDMGLVRTHVSFAEQELSVQVGDIDLIQINHVNVLDAREGQVLKNLATEATSTNDKNSCIRVSEAVENLLTLATLEIFTESTSSIQNSMQVTPSVLFRCFGYFHHFLLNQI